MRSLRFLVFLSLALATTSARAQDTTSVRDTLAYTTTIVTVRAKPFANAQGLGRVDAAAPVRLYTCSAGSAARLKLAGTAKRAHLKRDPLRRSHPTQMSRGSRSSTYAIPAGDSSTSPVASSYSRSRSR